MHFACRNCCRFATSRRLLAKHGSQAVGLRTYAAQVGQNRLNPALLTRAQRLSAHYERLSKDAERDTDFTPETATRQKKLAELQSIYDMLNSWKIANTNLEELHRIIAAAEDDDEMRQLAKEDLVSSEDKLVEISISLEQALLPRHPQSHFPALMEIRSGVGGDEANIFANDLFRMYEKYAASMRWDIRLYSVTRVDIGDGVTEAIFTIAGKDAYGRLRGEAGVHRVQRTPATESKGRTHTSTVSVNVLPEIDETVDESEFEKLDMSEVKLEVMRSRGAGGQHVNRTESAVRLTHLPTGLSISMQDSRSQHANKRAAFAILRSKLSAQRREKAAEIQVGMRRSQVASTDRSEKIRTYNYAQSRVTDHRCGYSSHDLEGVMEGTTSLDLLLDKVSQWIANEELKSQMELE